MTLHSQLLEILCFRESTSFGYLCSPAGRTQNLGMSLGKSHASYISFFFRDLQPIPKAEQRCRASSQHSCLRGAVVIHVQDAALNSSASALPRIAADFHILPSSLVPSLNTCQQILAALFQQSSVQTQNLLDFNFERNASWSFNAVQK